MCCSCVRFCRAFSFFCSPTAQDADTFQAYSRKISTRMFFLSCVFGSKFCDNGALFYMRLRGREIPAFVLASGCIIHDLTCVTTRRRKPRVYTVVPDSIRISRKGTIGRRTRKESACKNPRLCGVPSSVVSLRQRDLGNLVVCSAGRKFSEKQHILGGDQQRGWGGRRERAGSVHGVYVGNETFEVLPPPPFFSVSQLSQCWYEP